MACVIPQSLRGSNGHDRVSPLRVICDTRIVAHDDGVGRRFLAQPSTNGRYVRGILQVTQYFRHRESCLRYDQEDAHRNETIWMWHLSKNCRNDAAAKTASEGTNVIIWRLCGTKTE